MPVLTTFDDLIAHGREYLGNDPGLSSAGNVRRAVQLAWSVMPSLHPWMFLMSHGRISFNAAVTDGTVEYDHTGGTYERMLTISGATWPTWAAYGQVRIGDVVYEVDQRKTATVLTLSRTQNPGADVAAGQAYTLYRDTYPLPVDFIQGDDMVVPGRGTMPDWCHPRDFVRRLRFTDGPSAPRFWTITGDQNYFGALAARFWPPPDAADAVDFLYRRRLRALGVAREATGKVTVTADSAAVSGSGTAFTSLMVGSVIRTGTAADDPTGPGGLHPAQQERVVVSVTDATSLVVDDTFTATQTLVKYVVSDPIDLEESMRELFYREVERQIRLVARMKPNDAEDQHYQLALTRAMEADARFQGRRASRRGRQDITRLADYPGGVTNG